MWTLNSAMASPLRAYQSAAPSTSPISYLAYISPISRLYLAYISPISRRAYHSCPEYFDFLGERGGSTGARTSRCHRPHPNPNPNPNPNPDPKKPEPEPEPEREPESEPEREPEPEPGLHYQCPQDTRHDRASDLLDARRPLYGWYGGKHPCRASFDYRDLSSQFLRCRLPQEAPRAAGLTLTLPLP